MKVKRPMNNLKLLRKSKGLSQKALAEKVGIRWNVISTYERGVRIPDVFTLYSISVALGCTMDYLMQDFQN